MGIIGLLVLLAAVYVLAKLRLLGCLTRIVIWAFVVMATIGFWLNGNLGPTSLTFALVIGASLGLIAVWLMGLALRRNA